MDYEWAAGTAQGAEGGEESGDVGFVGGVAAGGAPEGSFYRALLAVGYDKGGVRVVGHIYGSLTTIWTVVFGLLEQMSLCKGKLGFWEVCEGSLEGCEDICFLSRLVLFHSMRVLG
jgi:hypothetical protein